jgi:hypothetical protein
MAMAGMRLSCSSLSSARRARKAGHEVLSYWEVLSFEFWVLSYPETLKGKCRALSENQKLRTQNSELLHSSH